MNFITGETYKIIKNGMEEEWFFYIKSLKISAPGVNRSAEARITNEETLQRKM